MESPDDYPELAVLENPTVVPPPHPAFLEYAKEMDTYIRNVFPHLAKEFDKRYLRWQYSWRAVRIAPGLIHLTKRGGDLTTGRRFQMLTKLEGKIIPLVMKKLLAGELEPPLRLYNAIEKTKRFKVNPQDILNFHNLERQASLVLELNIKRNAEFDNLVTAWEAWCRLQLPEGGMVWMDDHSVTHNTWFRGIVNMGTTVLHRVMIRYRQNPEQPWHQLMGTIAFSGWYEELEDNFDKQDLYQSWRRWFEEDEGEYHPGGFTTDYED